MRQRYRAPMSVCAEFVAGASTPHAAHRVLNSSIERGSGRHRAGCKAVDGHPEQRLNPSRARPPAKAFHGGAGLFASACTKVRDERRRQTWADADPCRGVNRGGENGESTRYDTGAANVCILHVLDDKRRDTQRAVGSEPARGIPRARSLCHRAVRAAPTLGTESVKQRSDAQTASKPPRR